nr:MAG: hypothetical protein [uncultured archaeon]
MKKNIQKIINKLMKKGMKMEPLQIKNRKIVKQGDSHFFYIPKAYIDNEQIDPSEKYTVILILQEPEKIIQKNIKTQSLEV